jgi:hypothetical protein
MKHKNLIGALALLFAVDAHSAMVGFDPVNTSASVGDIFTLTLSGSDFVSTLDGGGLNLAFDPAVIHVNSVAVDSTVWEFFASSGTTDNHTGKVQDIIFNSFQTRTGSLPIATIEFLAFGPGTSNITLSESSLNPFASGGQRFDPPVSLGSATVTIVPVPAALLLFLSGLTSLFAFRSRAARC